LSQSGPPQEAKGKPRPEALHAANVGHVLAEQKAYMGLFIYTIGLKRAETRIMPANLAYNTQRLII
jgi:IS5 family transposase